MKLKGAEYKYEKIGSRYVVKHRKLESERVHLENIVDKAGGREIGMRGRNWRDTQNNLLLTPKVGRVT